MNDKFKTPICPECGRKMHRIITRTKSHKRIFYSVCIFCPNEEKSGLCARLRVYSKRPDKERAKAQATHLVAWWYQKNYGRTLFAE